MRNAPSRPRFEEGLTFIELMAAVTILVVGLVAIGAVFLGGSRLSASSRTNVLATNVLRNVVEELQDAEFSLLTQNYGTGTAKPDFWALPSGDVTFTNPGGAKIYGTIQFFDQEDAVPAAFSNLVGGFDLNANGAIDSGPITDYRILPVRITVQVDDDSGSRVVVVERVLCAGSSL